MKNVMVEYIYQGDENKWQQIVVDFINSVEGNEHLSGKFHYQIFTMPEGRRVHIGRWDSEETLQVLKNQPFFGEFAKAIQQLAGDSFKSQTGFEAFSTND